MADVGQEDFAGQRIRHDSTNNHAQQTDGHEVDVGLGLKLKKWRNIRLPSLSRASNAINSSEKPGNARTCR